MMTIGIQAGIRPGRRVGSVALAALFAALLFVLPVVPGLDAGSRVVAQEEQDEDAPRSGRKTQALSKKVYDLITQANELVDAEDYNGARALLDKIRAMDDLSAYEKAQLYSFYGFLYYNSEDYPRAKQAYKTVLEQPELPEALEQQTLKTLAQLEFATEQYNPAIDYARRYMDLTGPDPDMLVLIGTAYYQLEQPAKIIEPVERAIELARQRGKPVKENWWLLLRVAYWEQDDFQKVREILETLVVNWPKKEYWTQLSGIYFELKDEPRQLAAYQAAYDQGLLTSSQELVQMAQLFMQADVPYKGAKVLEEGLESGAVERNVRNLRLLSQAWQMAQEDSRAIEPLRQAAAMSDDGELYARLANSHLNLSNYDACIDASRKALDKGGLKDTGYAWLVLGMCQFEDDRLAAAKESFQRARRFDKTAKNAGAWFKYVENEQQRLAQLEASLQRVREGS